MEEMLVDEQPAAHWTTQAFGVALISAALLILTIVGLILFGAEDAAFIGLPAVVAVVVTVVVWRSTMPGRARSASWPRLARW